MPSTGRAARARARRSWPVERYALGQEPSDDLTATTTLDERIAMMRPLALADVEALGARRGGPD